MSQHDFNIANQGYAALRADLNDALEALASCSSGTSAPSTTYDSQLWNDTTNHVLNIRNEADSAWIPLANLDQANAVVKNFIAGLGTVSAPTYSFSADADTGIYHPTTNVLGIAAGGVDVARFNTAASGVNYFNFTASATTAAIALAAAGSDTNVSISYAPKGTGTNNFSGNILLNTNKVVMTASNGNIASAGQVSAVNIALASTSGDYHAIYVNAGDGSNTYLTLQNTTAGVRLLAGNNEASLGTITSDPLILYANSTEHARIESGGDFLFGFSSGDPVSGSSVNGVRISKAYPGNVFAGFSAATHGWILNRTANSGSTHITIRYQGTDRGSIVGTAGGTTYNTSSDYRQKDGVKEVEDPIHTLMKLHPVSFYFKTDAAKVRRIGFLAHEAQDVMPEAVTGEKDAMQRMGNLYRRKTLGYDKNDEPIYSEWELFMEDTQEPENLSDEMKWEFTEEKPLLQGIDHSWLVPLAIASLQDHERRLAAAGL